MISDDWNVYIVDVCESAETHPPLRFKNFCAQPFIKVTIHNLEKLLQNVANNEREEDTNTDINRLNYFLNNFNKSISIVNNNKLE